MKKMIVLSMVLACVVGIVIAESVTSANIVGYAKVTANKGTLSLVAMNFDSGGADVDTLFGDQLPSGSIIYIWDKINAEYIRESVTRFGWNPGTNTITAGSAFWISVPDTAPSNSYEVTLSGDVMVSDTNVVSGLDGITATGFYFPVEVAFTNTALAAQMTSGSAIHIWNGSGYDRYMKTRFGWDAAASALVIGPTTGFWIENITPIDWEEPRPFDL